MVDSDLQIEQAEDDAYLAALFGREDPAFAEDDFLLPDDRFTAKEDLEDLEAGDSSPLGYPEENQSRPKPSPLSL